MHPLAQLGVPLDGDVLGGTVNLAARVAAQAGGGKVLASGTFANGLWDAAEARGRVADPGLGVDTGLREPVDTGACMTRRNH